MILVRLKKVSSNNNLSYSIGSIKTMADILRKMAITIIVSALLLMLLFLLFDLGVLGAGIKISNMYYLFMTVLAGVAYDTIYYVFHFFESS